METPGGAPSAASPAGPDTLSSLRAAVNGQVLSPGDPGYEDARLVWNGMIDRRPAVIVLCDGTQDVVAAVNYARGTGLPLAIKGGGHNVAGMAVCDGGVMVDLSQMHNVEVNAAKRTVRAQGGAVLGDVDREAQKSGLAVPVGVVSRTGIAGLSLHGGLGLLTRKHGLTCDNLVAAEIVTASGEVVEVDSAREPDLLWALRGGGGNFGVVTSFEFQGHPVGPDVFLGFVFYPAEHASECIRAFRDYMRNAPDEVSGILVLWTAPEEDPIPEQHRGKPVAIVAACHCGSPEEGERVIAPLREIVEPLADISGRIPYLDAQQLFDPDYPDGRRYYWKSIFLDEMPDEVVQTLVDHAARRPSPLTSLDVWALGGLPSRTDAGTSAYAERSAPFLIGIESNWEDPADDEANVEWARDVYRDLQRYSSRGIYLNFPGFGEEGEASTRKSYGPNYDRLQRIKTKYDPSNLFRHNVNIAPAGT